MKFGIYTLIIENYMKRIASAQFSFLMDFGWGNGYVLLPENHPLYGIHYDDIGVDVHGGLTFSEYFDIKRFLEWINGLEIGGDVSVENYKKFDKYWMIGFDTNHHGDNLFICSKEYVINETNNLLEQCLEDNIKGMRKYKSVYLRKDKLKRINASMNCNE